MRIGNARIPGIFSGSTCVSAITGHEIMAEAITKMRSEVVSDSYGGKSHTTAYRKKAANETSTVMAKALPKLTRREIGTGEVLFIDEPWLTLELTRGAPVTQGMKQQRHRGVE
jgi:hypothetical protein